MSTNVTDDELREFLLNECALTIDEIKHYIDNEVNIRNLSSQVQIDLFITDVEIDQLFDVMKQIVNSSGTTVDPDEAYKRAMGII